MDTDKSLAVAALAIDMLSAYVLVKRIHARYKALRPSAPANLRLVS